MKATGLVAGLVMVLASGGQGQVQNDLQRMSGTWAANVLEVSGKSTSAEDRAKFKIKIAIQGDKYVLYFDNKQLTTGTIRLDPSKNPPAIDAMPAEGPQQGKIQPGIYQFVGNEMKVIFGEPGQPRPTTFKTRDKSAEVMIIYQRVAN